MPETRYRHKTDLVITDLNDELVLLDPKTRQMFSLNKVGRVLWLNLPTLGLDATVQRITEEFEVAHDVANTDAQELVDHLIRAGLLEGQ